MGCILGVVITIVAFIVIIYDFKLQVIKLREGKCDLSYNEGGIDDAGDFPGMFISNCVIGFIIITIMFTFVGAILFHELFWKLMEEYWLVILIFLIPFIINIIQEVILLKVNYDTDSDTVKRRGYLLVLYSKYRLAQLTEFISFFLLILGGVLASILRFIIGFIALLIGINIDRP